MDEPEPQRPCYSVSRYAATLSHLTEPPAYAKLLAKSTDIPEGMRIVQESLRRQYLNAMGITVWESRYAISDETGVLMSVQAPEIDIQPGAIAAANWQTLQAEVAQCQACQLCQGRTQTVFGVGDTQADLLIVGEAPGEQEDLRGEPFVGRAGQLLDAMLQAIGFNRQQIYIANILKCRPPRNRDPSAEEVAQCTPYLERQIALLQPKLMVAVGRVAAHYLLDTKLALSRLRGREHRFGAQGTPLWVTYHPAYLLRSPNDKSKAYQDLLAIKQRL